MKYLVMILVIICSTQSFADEAPEGVFSFEPNFVIGGGIKNSENSGGYAAAKVAVINHVRGVDGAMLLGIGVATDSNDTKLIVSPISIYHEHLSLSVDIGNNLTGLSLGYRF